jgi:predicted CXXCH cytochrome family protein
MTRRLLQSLTVLAALIIVARARAASGPSEPPSNEVCLACHGNPAASTKLADGEALPLYVNPKQFAHSVHGGKLACTDCHADITSVPHPARHFNSRRAMSLAYYELCKRCHFAQYGRLLDGVHYAALAKGNKNAPTCVDCHGSHYIGPPDRPRTRVSATCGKCHRAVAAAYGRSVHGEALAKGNADVPVCTDCHRPHDNTNPMSVAWHLRIPRLCARCHTNQELMAKYGISTHVLTTYLADFHGMTASLYRSEDLKPAMFTATCTDCHGVHDITRVEGLGSKVMEAHLLKVCQRCHPGATANFPAAWLGHYEPSLKHAPLVYLVKLFYMIFIPFVIGGLIIQILLHLWRVVVNR